MWDPTVNEYCGLKIGNSIVFALKNISILIKTVSIAVLLLAVTFAVAQVDMMQLDLTPTVEILEAYEKQIVDGHLINYLLDKQSDTHCSELDLSGDNLDSTVEVCLFENLLAGEYILFARVADDDRAVNIVVQKDDEIIRFGGGVWGSRSTKVWIAGLAPGEYEVLAVNVKDEKSLAVQFIIPAAEE